MENSAPHALPAESVPLVGVSRAVTLIALALATFMQVLDTSIANVSIPTIAGHLGVSSDQGTWVITTFAVANGVTVPLTGWLMRRFGVVRTFVVSTVAFTAASLLCGLAWSLPTLLFFRVLQGGVSGPMIPGSQALLLTLFPPQKKGTALAIWSMTTLVAPICGPIMGGYISDNYPWEWIFLINVPIGIFCSIVCWRSLRYQETPTKRLPIDRLGLLLLFVWVGSLQIVLDQGKDLDWFSSPIIVTFAIITAVSLVAWLIWELDEPEPAVNLQLLRHRSFALGTVMVCLTYAVYFGNVVLLPLWLQTDISYTATWAGLVAAPSGFVAVVVSPLTGRLVARFDARIIAGLSFAMFAMSYFWRAGYTQDADFAAFVAPLLVQGAALGLFFVSTLTISLDGLAPEIVPAASGLSNFLRITAGSFATSLTTTFWDRREAFHQSRLAETLTGFDPHLQRALQTLRGTGATDRVGEAILTGGLVQQGYLLSSLDLFYLSGWVVLALIPLCWFVRRPVGGGGPVAAD